MKDNTGLKRSHSKQELQQLAELFEAARATRASPLPAATGAHLMLATNTCICKSCNTVIRDAADNEIKVIPCTATSESRFQNRCLLQVMNSLLLTATIDSFLGICRLRVGFPHAAKGQCYRTSKDYWQNWQGSAPGEQKVNRLLNTNCNKRHLRSTYVLRTNTRRKLHLSLLKYRKSKTA